MNYPRRPLDEILRTAALEVPDRPAIAFLGASITYGELRSMVARLATAFARLGIDRGDRVGIMLPNCPQYVVAAFAALRLGAVVVNVNPLYTPREVAVVAGDSGMRLLLTLDALAPVAMAARAETGIEHLVVTSLMEYAADITPATVVAGTVAFADLLAVEPDLPRVEIDPDDVAVLQYTGGTTGVPKGAMLSHRNIFANVVQMQCWTHADDRRGEDCYLMVIPFFHVYGFTVGMMGGVWRGVQLVLVPKYDVVAVLEAIRDYRPTFFPAVPTIYTSLLNHPKAREYGIDKVQLFNSGSAPLPLEVIEQFERLTDGTLNEGYGLSEASPVTHTTAKLARRKPGSVGLPLPDTDVKVVDLETGTHEVPIGEAGELCIAGPQVMKGYWNRPDETAIALRADASGRVWLHTGDVARVDEDGYTFIMQRKKDMIIVAGFNVYPSEVEGVLYGHPAVMEAAVVGVPDVYRGEVVKAFVVLKSGATVADGELAGHCRRELAEYKVPREIEVRESLPKSAVGKILHRVLRDEQETT
jgi:long-chain acyl-CoA synthetase